MLAFRPLSVRVRRHQTRRMRVALLTYDDILQMFRDFGLDSEEERRCVLSSVQADPADAESSRTLIFTRVESMTAARDEGHAELA